ncbi:MAG: hypothetical protein EKK62_01615 [Acidimicrobiia bacterium]|nr:MAG: hypothetical protein EKK62_01615 [Acidimicrobiia bacterium]
MTPQDLAAHIAAQRAWWTRWAEAGRAAARRAEADALRLGIASRYDDPPITLRASVLEGLLVDAWLLAQVAATVDDLEDDEAAAVARHTYTHPRSEP